MYKRYRKYFILIIFLGYLLNIFYSIGYHHLDEHFQILEFANYKLGKTEQGALAWEYHEKIRPTLQPTIAYLIIKYLNLIGIEKNFHIAIFLRLISALLSLIVFWKLFSYFWAQYKKKIKDEKFLFYLFYFCLTFWFMPYLHVRFSSENWSSIFFWFAFYLMMKNSTNKLTSLILSGISLALAFQFRFQIGFCILGLFLWIWIVNNKFRIKKNIIIPASLMVLFIILITYYVDAWFYGERVLPAFRYFDINIIQEKAKEFGDDHFFVYFFYGAEGFILPFGIITLLIILSFFYFHKKHPICWALLPFIVAHLLLSHKEIRFMFPIINALPIIIFISMINFKEQFEEKLSRILNSRALKISLQIYFIVNFLALLGRATYPAEYNLAISKYLVQKVRKQKFDIHFIISYHPDMAFVAPGVLPLNFYKAKGIYEKIIHRDLSPKERIKKIHMFIKEIKGKDIDSFYVNFRHTRFYSGERPFPKDFLFMRNQCSFEYNMLEEIQIKYNLYRLVRSESKLNSLFKCNI